MAEEGKARILFITNADHGQANVILAVAQELALSRRDFDIHLASFASIHPRILDINIRLKKRHAVKSPAGNSEPPTIIFHELPGPHMGTLIKRHNVTVPHRPGEGVRPFRDLLNCVLGWTNDEYIATYTACLKLLQELTPAATICDPGLWHGNDACRTLKLPYILLVPSSLKEVVGTIQPSWTQVAKYPFMATGLPYPLPWSAVLPNLWSFIGFIRAMISTGHVSRLQKVRKEAGMTHEFSLIDFFKKENLHLSPALTSLDWEYAPLPDNVVPCGPIVLPLESVEESDPGLAEWLGRRRTVLINLGTHFSSEEGPAVEVGKGLQKVLQSFEDIQVLWKLKFNWRESDELSHLMKRDVDGGRVKIVDRLDNDPASLLATGNIVVSVNHGGANSFYEACWAGIPQVVLPVWWDTYEYAARAEYLGIGVYGNKGVAPGVGGVQFADALLQAVDSEKLKQKARAIGQECRKREGREVAAEKIVEWVERSNKTV